MANITKTLLDAMSIVANKSAEEVSSDKTIKAIVKKNINTSEGKYLITYNSGDFFAYTQSGSTDVYQIGEQVYILVPAGDMSQRKFILGRVTGDEDNTSEGSRSSSLLNDYTLLGTNPIEEKTYRAPNNLYVKKMQPLQLNSHSVSDFYYCYLRDKSAVSGLPQEYDSIAMPTIGVDEDIFINSAKQAEALMVRAKFKASIDTDNIGNYGLIVNVAFADTTNPQTDDDGNVTYPPKLVAYTLDTNKMTGNPMKYYDFTSQYMVADFNGENYLYVDSIIAFSEGFVPKNISAHNKYDDVYIYIDDIEIRALNEITAVNGDYKLQLTTPQGNTIKTGEGNDIIIKAKTTYLNKDITKATLFYWGIKDPSITSSNEKYNAKIGTGYRYIDSQKTETLTLTPNDLTAAENIYQCVAIYQEDIILKTTISIYNNNNKLEITIDSDQGTAFQFNEGSPTLTCLINGKSSDYMSEYSDSSFSFVWSKVDDEVGAILLNETSSQLEASKEKELQECSESADGLSSAGRTAMQVLSYYAARAAQVKDVSYPAGINGPKINLKLKDVNTFATYSCSVYRAGVYIGYGSITLQNSKEVINTNYYITITNGNQVFQYDEAGVAPNSEKQKEPTEVLDLTAVFHSPQGAEVTPKSVKWIVPTENTMLDIPSLGLETDEGSGERCYVGDTYPLAIKDTYEGSYTNNQLIAVVTHVDGTEYRQSTSLLFTKVGEIGTNGTDTVVKINELINIPADEYLTIIKTPNGTGVWNDEQHSSITDAGIGAALYTNNTLNSGFTAQWRIADTKSTTVSRNYTVESASDNSADISYDGDSEKLDNRILEVEIASNGQYYYGFYPISAIEYQDGYDYTNYPIKILKEGTLRTILYASDGTNPSYNENQGGHIALGVWPQTGYIRWIVESGPETNGQYNNPNFLLSKSPSSKTGSKELSANSSQDVQDFIMVVQDTVEACAAQASSSIRKYIEEFASDIDKTLMDSILPSATKIKNIKSKLDVFIKKAPSLDNVYIKNVHAAYTRLYNQINSEFNAIKADNAEYTKIYNKVQDIWKSEWPSVINNTRLRHKSGSPNTIQKLIQAYQQGYEDRSMKDGTTGKRTVPIRTNTFNATFLNLLDDIDEWYNEYVNNLVGASILNKTLVEYAKVMYAYIYSLVLETQNVYTEDVPSSKHYIYTTMEERYSIASSDWLPTSPRAQTIGKAIYDMVVNSAGVIAAITSAVRDVYKYYQALFVNVKKYQATEESETLNTFSALLSGQDPEILDQVYIVPNEHFNGLYMNNNLVGIAYYKDSNGNTYDVAKIYIPIIMTLNTYELASLNGWDGTSVEITDEYIMTPQIGAGIKDHSTNTFTGMVMGAIGNTVGQPDKIGLVGYADGRQSVFIDSKTGSASFGFAADDDESNEGRIELVPNGVSKIGNWKIGNRFLYNIIRGDYEKRADADARGSNIYKKMIPHDKYGIMMSSDQPYIHIKGQLYEDSNLSGIDYDDEYNNINPGDSLELRLDPNNDSLFSIVQHTSGFGDENIDDIGFGYRFGNQNNERAVIPYTANVNIPGTDQIGTHIQYYIYKINKNSSGDYVPYYKQVIPTFSTFNDSASYRTYFYSTYLANSADISFIQACSLNQDTGIITYTPTDVDFANGGYSLTPSTSGTNFLVTIQGIGTYTQDYHTNIGTIKHSGGTGTIAKYMLLSFAKASQISTGDVYMRYPIIQYYITDNPNSTTPILQAHAISGGGNISVGLFSVNNAGLEHGKTYYLKAHIWQSWTQTVNPAFTIRVGSAVERVKWPEINKGYYGEIEITGQATSATNYTATNNISTAAKGTYTVSTNNVLTLTRTNVADADYVVWRHSTGEVIGGGRGGKFYGTAWSSSANNTLALNYKPSATDPVHIMFLQKDACCSIETQRTSSIVNGREVITITTYYKFNGVSMVDKDRYTKNIVFPPAVSYGWSYSWSANSNKSYVTVPASTTALRIVNANEVSMYTGIQAIPLAKTSWEFDTNNQLVQKTTFYKGYYDLVNSNNKYTQYGYINVTSDGNSVSPVYYKYIKTLEKEGIRALYNMAAADLPEGFSTGTDAEFNVKYLTGPTNADAYQDILKWKEFLRVGLDENGRLFTNGALNKRTYSRTGNIFAFNKAPDLYGQEIRTEVLSDEINKLLPIIKIFTQATSTTTAKTTYITQGKEDNGNISVRTIGNTNYIELAVSEDYNNLSNGLIPVKTSFINLSHRDGIQLQSQNENNLFTLTSEGFIGTATEIILNSGPSITQKMKQNYTGITSPYIVLTSKTGEPSAIDTATMTSNDYRIRGNSFGISLEIGTNTSLKLRQNDVSLHQNVNNYIQIDSNEGIFKYGAPSLRIKSTRISMEYDTSYIKLQQYNNNTQYISLYSNRSSGSLLTISDGVRINSSGGLYVEGGTGGFSKQLYTDSDLYTYGSLFVGRDYSSGATRYGDITMYGGSGGHWVKFYYTMIKDMLHWFARRRWHVDTDETSVNFWNYDEQEDGNSDFWWTEYSDEPDDRS